MKLIMTIAILLYNLVVLAGTAYMVEVHHWSPWWFAFSIMLFMTIDLKER